MKVLIAWALMLPALYAAEQKDVAKTVSLDPQGSVVVSNHKGSIAISAWDRSDVEIKARIVASGDSSGDRRLFDATEVLIRESAGAVSIETKYTNLTMSDANNPQVHYTIRVPRAARLTIHDHKSAIEITDLAGNLDMDTHKGSVNVRGQSGAVRLTTHASDVHLQFASFNANSMIETHNGSIQVSLPSASRFDLQTNVRRGAALRSDFPIVARMTGRGRDFGGSVNGGGPTLRIVADRGGIQLHAQ